jgi:hypothetical protein
VTVHEKFASRRITDAESPSAETVWQVFGNGVTITNETQAYAALVAHPLPTIYTFPSGRVASLVNIGISDITNAMWEFVVRYSTFEPKQVDEVEYEFEVGLQEVTITHALATTAYTGGGRTAPNFQKGVNISADGKVQGVSVGQPSFAFSYTKYWDRADVDAAYQLVVKGLAGKYNNATFPTSGGLAAGTVRFMGARGAPKGKKWPITYRFEHNDNESSIAVGDITVATKLGWQYLDVYRRTIADGSAKKKIEVPHSVYVHTLPPGPGDFSLLGLG